LPGHNPFVNPSYCGHKPSWTGKKWNGGTLQQNYSISNVTDLLVKKKHAIMVTQTLNQLSQIIDQKWGEKFLLRVMCLFQAEKFQIL